MNINELVHEAVSESMPTLGSETIDVGGEKVEAVCEVGENYEEFEGGSKDHRSLNASFPTIPGLTVERGLQVLARDKKWKIDTYKVNLAMTELNLVEPTRQSGVYD